MITSLSQLRYPGWVARPKTALIRLSRPKSALICQSRPKLALIRQIFVAHRGCKIDLSPALGVPDRLQLRTVGARPTWVAHWGVRLTSVAHGVPEPLGRALVVHWLTFWTVEIAVIIGIILFFRKIYVNFRIWFLSFSVKDVGFKPINFSSTTKNI